MRSISINESQLESPPQRLTPDQEAQCYWNAISRQMISRDIDQIADEPEPDGASW